jgi:copper chaperone NosL
VLLYDFYSWGYDYGHHLDPKAAIQVPGLFYQPPLIGHKTLLNFDAYSYPDTGGWIIVGAGILCFGVWIYERFGRRAGSKRAVAYLVSQPMAGILFIAGALLTSCSTKPEPFAIGRDVCTDCRMAVMDLHFGAELITAKGRVYKFDDLHCLQHYLSQNEAAGMGAQVLVADHEHPGTLLPIETAWALTDAAFKSPMNSNTAFFNDHATASRAGRTPVAACKILKL